MKVYLNIDKDRLTLGDLLDIESAQEGTRPMKTIAGVIARFMTDENGAYLAEDAAMLQLRKLTVAELKDVTEAFSEQANGTAIPPVNGGQS